MATNKPTDVLSWAVSGTKVAPDAPHVTNGWAVGENPPAQYYNYIQNVQGDGWNTFIDERFEVSGPSFDTLILKAPDTAAGSLILRSASNAAASSTGGLLRVAAGKGTTDGGSILIQPQIDTEITEAFYDGGNVTVLGGTTGVSGGIPGTALLKGGATRASFAPGGNATVQGGDGPPGVVTGGSAILIGGTGDTGGNAQVLGGVGNGGVGGNTEIRSGASTSTKGGDCTVSSGLGTTTVPPGNLRLQTPAGQSDATNGAVEIVQNSAMAMRIKEQGTYLYKPIISNTDYRHASNAPTPFVLACGVSGFTGANPVAAGDPVEPQQAGFGPANALIYVQKTQTSARFLGIALGAAGTKDDVLVAYAGPVTISIYSSPDTVQAGDWFEVQSGTLTNIGQTRTDNSIGMALTDAAIIPVNQPFVMLITRKTS